MTQTNEYMSQIAELKQRGLTGVQLTAIFLKRRFQPLRTRVVPMWEYKGAGDKTRLRKDELSSNEVDAFLRNIIKSAHCDSSLSVEPFWLQILSML